MTKSQDRATTRLSASFRPVIPHSVFRTGLLIAGSVFVMAGQVLGQAWIDVSVLDPVYRDLEKLAAFDLVDGVMVGQRPYNRMDFARFAAQARSHLTAAHPSLAHSIVDRLEQRFAREVAIQERPDLGGRPSVGVLDRVWGELVTARAPGRPVPDRGWGNVAADINPLFGYREGRGVVDGTLAAVETAHWIQPAKQLVVYVHPRLQFAAPSGSVDDSVAVSLEEAYAALMLGNFSLLAGRAHLVWGQGRHGGLVAAPNARGWDMVKITNREPRVPPSFLRFLGPTKGVFFFATMAADRDRHFLNSYMLGYKVSVQPAKWLEIGGSYTIESGGEGSPEATFWERLADGFFITNAIIPEADLQFSNKIASLEFRATLAEAGGLQIYGEAAFDDMTPTRPDRWLTQDTGWLLGAYVPRLLADGRIDLSIEYQFNGIRVYRHTQFQSGLAVDRRFFGNLLGPEGRALYAETHWDATKQITFGLMLAYEARSFDEYQPVGGEPRVKVETGPQERRYRTVAALTYRPVRGSFDLEAKAGFERVNSFAFQPGESRDNLLGQVRFVWRLR